jgi:antitoxin component YwqK of YwqJK toxin-antitoxin module
VKEEGIYKDGIKKDVWTSRNENGQKLSDKIYNNGFEIERTEWSYYENGKKKFEENYKDGKKDGLMTIWWPNGQLYSEETWKDGNPL